MNVRQKLTETESTAAFVVGGGITLIILGFLLASAQSGMANFEPQRLNVVMIVGALLFVAGLAAWLLIAQPWTKFDDWSKPLYTGHEHHDSHAAPAEHAPAAEEVHAAAPVSAVLDGSDNLTIIEGIGPKIANALHGAGIHTFADLASRQPADVERIVRDSGVRMVGHADAWIEQAQLAAEGKNDELKALQEKLGKRH